MADSPKIFPLGDNCATIDFGNEISVELNAKAIVLASHLGKHPFPGFIEAVPAYSSVAVFYRLIEVRRNFPEYDSAFDAVTSVVRNAHTQPHANEETMLRVIEIPVDFSDGAALDLNVVAEFAGITPGEVIERFIAKRYRVYMLGFLPGFAYMGEVDETIAAPRKDSPRTKVPKGSVGIASGQTGIYPLESPGGWQIIGRTNAEMFSADRDPPCLLSPGDEVRFIRDT
jgi:inhibitor of KinA